MLGRRPPRGLSSAVRAVIRNTGIALAAVPEHFFDQDKWNELVSSLGGREKALHRISHPDHVTVVHIRRQVAQQQSAAGAKAREEESNL